MTAHATNRSKGMRGTSVAARDKLRADNGSAPDLLMTWLRWLATLSRAERMSIPPPWPMPTGPRTVAAPVDHMALDELGVGYGVSFSDGLPLPLYRSVRLPGDDD